MQIKEIVLKKIQEEKQNHLNKEFGGWLLVKNGQIVDIIFDIDEEVTNQSFVQFDVKKLLQLPKEQRELVKGWFHRHPIQGMSPLDENTTEMLTRFWGECYSLVLQEPTHKLLCVRTRAVKKFGNASAWSKLLGKDKKVIVEEEAGQIQMENEDGEQQFIQKPSWIAKYLTFRLP